MLGGGHDTIRHNSGNNALQTLAGHLPSIALITGPGVDLQTDRVRSRWAPPLPFPLPYERRRPMRNATTTYA